MHGSVTTVGVDEARTRLPALLRAANHEGKVTVVTKRGVAYAAIVPVSKALGDDGPKLSALRGSAAGCYGNVREFVGRLRDEW